jgi:hypothetical protein
LVYSWFLRVSCFGFLEESRSYARVTALLVLVSTAWRSCWGIGHAAVYLLQRLHLQQQCACYGELLLSFSVLLTHFTTHYVSFSH